MLRAASLAGTSARQGGGGDIMIYSWEDTGVYFYILCFIVFALWGIFWLRDWWHRQRKREAMIREAQERDR
jgi:hypothetical protein